MFSTSFFPCRVSSIKVSIVTTNRFPLSSAPHAPLLAARRLDLAPVGDRMQRTHRLDEVDVLLAGSNRDGAGGSANGELGCASRTLGARFGCDRGAADDRPAAPRQGH